MKNAEIKDTEEFNIVKKLLYFLRKNLYLLIPILAIVFWALISLIKDNFVLEEAADFRSFYWAGKYIFIDPDYIYSTGITPRYRYLPNFASVFAIISLFDYVPACWIFFFILLIFAFLSILEFDKILKLRNVDNVFNRFLILFVISNGLKIMLNFDLLQTKFIALYLILLFLRREIESKNQKRNNKEESIFLFIQLSILVFIVSLIPFIVFIIPIYLFDNVMIKDFLKKSQIKKYLILVGTFLIQNFMFLISPSLIAGFLDGLTRSGFIAMYLTPEYILSIRENILLPPNTLGALIITLNITIDFFLIGIISQILSCIITLILILNKKLTLEKKYAYFILFTFIFNVYFYFEQAFVTFLPIVTLLFIELKFENKLIDYIKQNYLVLMGLICIFILSLMPPTYLFYELLPFTIFIPLQFFLMRHTFVYIAIILVLFLLYYKKEKYKM